MSTGKSSKRKNQSIFENSTLIAANLVRASSFVLAEMALGPLSSPVLTRDPTTVNMRPGETGNRSTGYVMESDDGNSVDASAAEYIRKVKQQYYGSHDGAMAEISNSRIPPQPSNKQATYPR